VCLRQIVAVGMAIAEEDMHDRAGQRRIRAGPQHQGEIGLGERGIVIDVDGDDLGAALFRALTA
jgi:hypothetical protein